MNGAVNVEITQSSKSSKFFKFADLHQYSLELKNLADDLIQMSGNLYLGM